MKTCKAKAKENMVRLLQGAVKEDLQIEYDPEWVGSDERYEMDVIVSPDLMPDGYVVRVTAYDGNDYLWDQPVAVTDEMRVIDTLTIAEQHPNPLG